ncbi:aminotransferase class I/II-fold pyridoxal phosphate-dependent enzyme [Acinetobacter rudis]|uniref:Aminotransferase class I/II-fold pyridoxal phosphate-dependent enzyme n=1 Tax=Acinetobacter rudis TaxID=632955 RepID=A0AAW8J553_9GAMM|nr:aminotransferase class I/II-fold pyridoxal phosphate-dependent enzyme [Acinetobacter rudis]MDQ8934304.1 aminotransferase class I/II-fold pyridoxal phosphate-dependent enzyme [Acinetobacter rudis]MDQ9016388.1 aminotransferase class I/II-fold pyridoxal phosphate-dependent enzyme [Acinetobacter rudis]
MDTSVVKAEYKIFKDRGLKLDMSRGKPSSEQLELSNEIHNQLTTFKSKEGIDIRNYGGAHGLLEARLLFESLLDIPYSQIIVDNNSSLALMHDLIVFALIYGFPDGAPWIQKPISILCPVPGYDRHFAICEALGINMININMHEDGPDIEEIRNIVKDNPDIKGIWCVPKYSNPTGAIYSDEVVHSLATIETAATDFKIFWDDAYRFHHLTDERISTANILDQCTKAGYPNRPIIFSSTSKITLAGAGISALAASPSIIAWWEKCTAVRSIGPDKINHFRHVQFLKDRRNIEHLMEQHRRILKPKFDAVIEQFEYYLKDNPNISWTNPKGGYFIDLKVPQGFAKRTIELAKDLGITLTPAGAAFPYRIDPTDNHIRIAPSYPSLSEIIQAAKGISLSLLLALNE